MLDAIVRNIVRRLPLPPIQVVIEPSKVCNLKCDYCRRNEVGSVRQIDGVGNHFTVEQYREVLDKLRHLKVANWIGDGEPLLNPDFNKLIEISAKRGISTTFGTNGTLVTQADVDCWKKNKVFEVSVSIDSPIPEKYEEMRVGAKFDRVIESCRMISKAGIHLQLQIILFADTVKDIPKYVELCHDVGGWRIATPRPHLYGTLERYRSSYPVSEKADPTLKIAQDMMKRYKIKWYEPWYVTTYFRRCMWPFLSPYIQIGGTIQTCCFMQGEDKVDIYDGVAYKVPSSNFNMGNILTGDFDKIWYGDAYKELRRLLIKTEKRIGSTISSEDLHMLKRNTSSRFAYCEGCSWRWSIEC